MENSVFGMNAIASFEFTTFYTSKNLKLFRTRELD